MKNYLYITGFLTFMAFIISFNNTDFFSSMTKIDYVDGTNTLKFTTKLNTEQISNGIKINPNTAGFEAEVKKYLNNNIQLYVNGEQKTLTFTGSQISGETVWVYYETGGVGNINTMKIKNTILLDTYPKQFNVVNIAYKGVQKTMSFQRGKEENEVSF